jgi:hypothetical protein
VVFLGRGDLHAGIVVADDAQDGGIGDDGLGVGHAGVRIGLIIEGGQFDLETQLGEGAGQLLEAELGAALDIGTHHRQSAGEGALGRELDDLLFFTAAGEEQAERRNRRCDKGNGLVHQHSSRSTFFIQDPQVHGAPAALGWWVSRSRSLWPPPFGHEQAGKWRRDRAEARHPRA